MGLTIALLLGGYFSYKVLVRVGDQIKAIEESGKCEKESTDELVTKSFIEWQKDAPLISVAVFNYMRGSGKIFRLLTIICALLWKVASPLLLKKAGLDE